MGTRYPELKLRHAVQNWAGVKNGREGAAPKAEGVRRRAGLPPPSAARRLGELAHRARAGGAPAQESGRCASGPDSSLAGAGAWLAALTAAGDLCVVCWSAEEAWQIVERYLREEIPRETAWNRR